MKVGFFLTMCISKSYIDQSLISVVCFGIKLFECLLRFSDVPESEPAVSHGGGVCNTTPTRECRVLQNHLDRTPDVAAKLKTTSNDIEKGKAFRLNL